MTIRPGEAWGTPHQPVGPPRELHQDHEILRALMNDPEAEVRAAGGDLARTLGSHRPRSSTATWTRVAIDLIEVIADDVEMRGLAHVVIRRRGWRGPVIFVANAEYHGGVDIAPRAHPGDGRLDVLEVAPTMSLRARLQARSRARTGTHLPHPDLRMRQITEEHWVFPSPMGIWVDGVRQGAARRIDVRVCPSAAHLVI